VGCGSESSVAEWEISEGDDDGEGDGNVEDPNSIKHMYRDSSWNQNYILYDPKPVAFFGTRGSIFFWK
jgi:hypothetical protein